MSYFKDGLTDVLVWLIPSTYVERRNAQSCIGTSSHALGADVVVIYLILLYFWPCKIKDANFKDGLTYVLVCLIPSTYIGMHSPVLGPAVLLWWFALASSLLPGVPTANSMYYVRYSFKWITPVSQHYRLYIWTYRGSEIDIFECTRRRLYLILHGNLVM